MLNVSRGSWSVATTVRAPEYQINNFLEHYVGLGADKIYIFFDDPEFTAYDADRFAGRVISFVCNDKYWETAYKAPPMAERIGRPDAVEIRQGVNALFAREVMTSEWLLHVDVDEFIYAKKDVSEVLSVYPATVFSVLLRTLEAVYDSVKPEGKETDTLYFKKSVQQKELLEEIYPSELLKCATNGLWGTIIGKSFIRKSPEIKSMSVHWPTPVDTSLTKNVPTYYIDLLHFEGQTYDLFKEKVKLRIYKNVAKHMPQTYKVRLDICKRAYEEHGDEGLLSVYRSFYVMESDTLDKAIQSGVVVKVNWSLGTISDHKILINNPIFDLNARLSNWGGTLIKSVHGTYLVYDSDEMLIKSAAAQEVVNRKNYHPVEIEVVEKRARLFVRYQNYILRVYASQGLLRAANSDEDNWLNVSYQDSVIHLEREGVYLSVAPSKAVTFDRMRASKWESFTLKEIYPQIS
ncbi:glycosyltransferase family 2 protein [Pseudomonas fulva]|uniref:glycosyltransferase family 2 protein n=1 Tax=Pseudomonas fulva TaxID=47880 RepID=UPI00048BC9E6|nr:glycosyltransferase family 2 protein [Pseudomonas fulva]